MRVRTYKCDLCQHTKQLSQLIGLVSVTETKVNWAMHDRARNAHNHICRVCAADIVAIVAAGDEPPTCEDDDNGFVSG